MAVNTPSRSSSLQPEELAIASLTSSIFNLLDTGNVFLRKLDLLRSKTRKVGIVRALSPLEPARQETTWLVGFIYHCIAQASPNPIKDTSSERRQSVSLIIDICVLQLVYLSDRLCVKQNSSITTQEAFRELFGGSKKVRHCVNVLNINGKDLAQLLAYLNGARPSIQRPFRQSLEALSMVPKVASPRYVGQEKTLKSMALDLCVNHRVALIGARGIGKTELCVQYAKRIRERNPSVWVFWINGQEIAGSLAELGNCLQVERNERENFPAITRQLRQYHPWLMIFDDFSLDPGLSTLQTRLLTSTDEQSADPVSKHIQHLAAQQNLTGRGNLIITSDDFNTMPNGLPRDSRLQPQEVIEILPLEKSKAVDLLWMWIKHHNLMTRESAWQLVERIGRTPLTLREVASLLNIMRLTAAEYLGDLGTIKEMWLRLLSEDRQDQRNTLYQYPVSDRAFQTQVTNVKELLRDEDSSESLISKSIPDANEVAAVPLVALSADIMTTASFVAILMLADSSLGRVLMMIEGNIEMKNKLEIPLRSYATRLMFDTASRMPMKTNSLPMAYAEFIQKHPKRVSLTLLQRALHVSEDRLTPALEHGEKSNRPFPFLLRTSSTSSSKLRTRSARKGSKAYEPMSDLESSEYKAVGKFLRNEATMASFIVDLSLSLAISPRVEDVGIFVDILANISKSAESEIVTVNYDIHWELQKVLQSEFNQTKSIKEVLVICGNAIDAQATTCAEYTNENWKLALPLLEALDQSNWGVSKSKTRGIYFSGSRESSDQRHSLRITIKDTPAVQADMSATLTWLAASIRYSEAKELSGSHSSIVLLHANEGLCFQIQCLPLEKTTGQEACWHQLFACMVIATGYPIRARHQGKGLEISYRLMTAMARTNLVTERDHGLVARGLQFMLVPTKVLEHGKDDSEENKQAVQWHVLEILNESDRDVTEKDRSSTLLNHQWLKVKTRNEFEQLTIRRAFLGWWDKIKINIATAESKPPDPSGVVFKSSAKDAGREFYISGAGVNLGGGGHGAAGGANLTATIPDRNVSARLAMPTSVRINLETRKAKNLVIYDTDTRRAWMLPYSSVLLYIVHLLEKIHPPATEKERSPYAATFSKDAPETSKACELAYLAIVSVLEETEDSMEVLQLESPSSTKPNKTKTARAKRLEEHLEIILTWLAEAETQSAVTRNKAMDIRHKKVYGIEMGDLITGDFLHRERRLHRTSGGWSILRRDAGVMFCAGIGDAISPVVPDSDDLCKKWENVPVGKDYLVAPICCLSRSKQAQSCEPPPEADDPSPPKRDDCFTIKTTDHTRDFVTKEWKVRAGNFSPCVNPKDEGHHKTCYRTTRMRIKRYRPASEENIKDFGTHMGGAVIFGRPERILQVKMRMKASWETTKQGLSRNRATKARAAAVSTSINGAIESAQHASLANREDRDYEFLSNVLPPLRGAPLAEESNVASVPPQPVHEEAGSSLVVVSVAPPRSVPTTVPLRHEQPERADMSQAPVKAPVGSQQSTADSTGMPTIFSDGTEPHGTSMESNTTVSVLHTNTKGGGSVDDGLLHLGDWAGEASRAVEPDIDVDGVEHNR